MDSDALISHLSQDIFGYLLEGRLDHDTVAEVIRPESLDTRFDEFDRLADLHFILRDAVEAFITDLDYQLRRIRTSTQQQSQLSRGAIEGQIDWPRTYQHRYSKEPGNTAVYVCDIRAEQYNIPENIVLKALLDIIADALDDVAEFLREDRMWVQQRWTGDAAEVERFQRLLERNVHLGEMRSAKPNEPTERMLETASNARDALYRDAAELVHFHDDLQRGSPAALEQLLTETMVAPEDQDTLFELFVLFRVIDALESLPSADRPTIGTLTTGRDAVATFSAPRELEVYYNQSGQQRGLSFLPEPEVDDIDRASRGDAVQVAAQEISGEFFQSKEFTSHTKRPDVLVVPRKYDDVTDIPPYLVVEVKNSTATDTVREGIRELLEYLAYMRRDDAFVFPPEAKFGTKPFGVLIVQDMPADGPQVQPAADQDLPITILQASEVSTQVPLVLARIFETDPSTHMPE